MDTINKKTKLLDQNTEKLLTPKIKKIEIGSIKSYTNKEYNIPNQNKIHISSITYPSLTPKRFFYSTNHSSINSYKIKNKNKSNMYLSKLETISPNFSHNFSQYKTTNKNDIYKDIKNLNYQTNISGFNKETFYIKKNNKCNYKIYKINIKRPKILSNRINEKNYNLTNINSFKNNITNYYKPDKKKILKYANNTYNINVKKNIDKNLIDSFVESLLNKVNDNKEKKDQKETDNKTHDLIEKNDISPIKYINYNFEISNIKENLFKNRKKENDGLGGEHVIETFMNNINDYRNSKKEYYDFKKPAGFELNYFEREKNDELIHSMFTGNSSSRNKKKRLLLCKDINKYRETFKKQNYSDYFGKLRQFYEKKNVPLDLIVDETLLSTMEIDKINKERKSTLNEVKKKLKMFL